MHENCSLKYILGHSPLTDMWYSVQSSYQAHQHALRPTSRSCTCLLRTCSTIHFGQYAITLSLFDIFQCNSNTIITYPGPKMVYSKDSLKTKTSLDKGLLSMKCLFTLAPLHSYSHTHRVALGNKSSGAAMLAVGKQTY